MIDIFNSDFDDLIHCFNKHDVEYMLVGGYAVILHGYIRSTSDMDIWVNRTADNFVKMMGAFSEFGLPTTEIAKDQFINNEEAEVYRYGIEPNAVDIISRLKGLDFNECYKVAKLVPLPNGNTVKLIHLNHLIAAKKAAGRHKDLNDIENLPPAEEL